MNKKPQKKWTTKKEARKAVKMIAEGESVPAAMRKLGYSNLTATFTPKILLKNRNFQEALNEYQKAVQDRNPKIFEKAARVMDEGLDAQEIKVFAHQGKIVDEKSYTDHPTRLKYAEFLARIFGMIQDKEQVHGNTYNVDMLVQLVATSRTERGLPLTPQ